jgi:hypothetical protein
MAHTATGLGCLRFRWTPCRLENALAPEVERESQKYGLGETELA